MINYQKVIQDLFDTSFDIRKDIFSKTVFIDKEIEDLYQQEYSKNSGFQRIISEIMLISGYVASILYIFLAFKRIFFLKICLGFLVLNLILLGVSSVVKSDSKKYYISLLQIVFISINLNLKINLLSFIYFSPEDDNYKEIIRVIIYDFVSINLFLLLKIEANIYISLGLNSLNILSCINSEIHSNEEHYYYLDMLIGTFLTLIFFAFRKAWDYRLRVIFSEKYKSDKLVMYTFEYINGLNGFHLNIKDDNKIFIDEKFSRFLNTTLANDENKLNGNLSPLRDAENNLGQPDSNLFNMEDLNLITYFLSKLKPYLSDVDLENQNHFENNNNNYNNNNNNNVTNNADEDSNNRIKSRKESELLNKELESIGQCYNLNYNSEKNNFVFNLNLNETKIMNKINSNNNNLIHKLNASQINLTNERLNTRVAESEMSLLDKIKFLKQFETNLIKSATAAKDTKTFKHIGIYFFKNSLNTYKYLDVYLRNIQLINSKTVTDLIFYDVTDSIVSKKAIIQQNTQKQKILAKIAHEFKTPVNSIIGLIHNMRDFISNNSFENEKTLDLIENLSNYIIFLVSDIIHYSNPRSIKDIKIRSEDVDLRGLLMFCYDILNSLLNCNSNKNQKIKTNLEIADCIDKICVLSDEFRIKQIVLNLLSNAVKFTNRGKITLKCEKHSSKNFVVIKVIDTGSGIREIDKAKIFQEFCVLENTNNDNRFFNSGLGLSICSLLASKLNLKLKFKSEYGVGSEFKVLIPITSELKEANENEKEKNNKSKEDSQFNLFKQETFGEKKPSVMKYATSMPEDNEYAEMDSSNIFSDKAEYYPIKNKNAITDQNFTSLSNLNEGLDKTTIIWDTSKGNFNINVKEIMYMDRFIPERSGSLLNKSLGDSIGSKIHKIPIPDIKRTIIQKKMNEKCLDDNNKKIFVIDDNQIIRNSIKKMIEFILKDKPSSDPIDIYTGSDGVDLIKFLFPENNIIDTQKVLCVFMDENMEYLNGSDAVKILRHLETKNKLTHVNVVTVSCHEDTRFVDFICNSGVDLFLSKPVSKNDIANIFKRFGII